LRDPDRSLLARAHALITPEAAVFVRNRLVYHGRIDDRYVDIGKARPQPLHRDLNEVLSAIVAGKSVPIRDTKAIGCAIADLP
jgi:hypothetical protein